MKFGKQVPHGCQSRSSRSPNIQITVNQIETVSQRHKRSLDEKHHKDKFISYQFGSFYVRGWVYTYARRKKEIHQRVHVASKANLSADQVLYAALHKVHGTVVEIELEEEKDHKPIWEMDVVTADRKPMERAIDGKTGDVLVVEEKKVD